MELFVSKKQAKTPLIYALEPRLLFDGDLGADIASAIVYRDGNNGPETPAETEAEAPAVAPENQRENITFEFHSARSAIVFIDGALQDTQTLSMPFRLMLRFISSMAIATVSSKYQKFWNIMTG